MHTCTRAHAHVHTHMRTRMHAPTHPRTCTHTRARLKTGTVSCCRWDDVNETNARIVFDVFSRKLWQYERLYKGWWQKQIAEYRIGRQKNRRIVYRLKEGR